MKISHSSRLRNMLLEKGEVFVLIITEYLFLDAKK